MKIKLIINCPVLNLKASKYPQAFIMTMTNINIVGRDGAALRSSLSLDGGLDRKLKASRFSNLSDQSCTRSPLSSEYTPHLAPLGSK